MEIFPWAWDKHIEYIIKNDDYVSILFDIKMAKDALSRLKREDINKHVFTYEEAKSASHFYGRVIEAASKRLKELDYKGDLP